MHPLVTFGRPILGKPELDAVADVFTRRRLTQGGRVQQFEERFQELVGGGRAVAVSSCMAALHLFWMAKGIGPGDEVICTALTHVATAHAIEMTGARAVFADVHPESGNLDPERVLDCITRNTRGVCVVHYLGQPGYMRSLVDICRTNNLFLLEDCALALGTIHQLSGMHVGLVGDAGCFSFHPVKPITTGEGGIFLTKHPNLADDVSSLRSFGLDTSLDAIALGTNYRMTEFQAAMGVEQLLRFPEFLRIRRQNAAYLKTLLKEFEPIGDHYAITVRVPEGKDRDEVRKRMLSHQVETSVYYKRPVPDMPYYRGKYGDQACPVARDFCYQRITLPVGPHLKQERIELIATEFRRALS